MTCRQLLEIAIPKPTDAEVGDRPLRPGSRQQEINSAMSKSIEPQDLSPRRGVFPSER